MVIHQILIYLIDLPKGDGLYASVWKGTISLDKKVLDIGQSAFVKNISAHPVLLSRLPAFFRDNPAPKPDEVEVEDIDFSQTGPHVEIPPGFYVGVTSGEVSVKSLHANRELVVKKDTAGFADVTGRHLKLLPDIPAFLKFDIYPAPDKFEVGTDIFGDSSLEDGLVCEVR